MDRRNFITSLTAANLAATKTLGAQATTEPSGTAANSDAPNILWICTDQQRWDTIGTLGYTHVRTPNIDRLCTEGTAFTHAHCQNPICTPSRASFLTGMYPRYLNACTNGNESWQNEAPLVTKTLADAGYDCGLAGKFHLSAAHNRIEPRPNDGYRVFHWSHHPHDSWPVGHAYKDWLAAQGHEYGPLKKKSGGGIPNELHQTKWCADRAIEFMMEKRSTPWLFSYNCFDPHPPLDPPKEYLDRIDVESLPPPEWTEEDIAEETALAKAGVHFQSKVNRHSAKKRRRDLAKYLAMIEQIDTHVGRMLEALEESGQRENTVVIFTSDHGHMIGDHGLYNKGCRFYEGLVRVPLIMSGPGIRADVKSDALVELTDITPTLLELAGFEPPPQMHGRSLAPVLTGQRPDHREFVRCTYTETLQGPQSWGTMIRDRRYKLCNYHGTGTGQLFDLKNDPGEHKNLWRNPEHTEIKNRLLVKSFDAEAMSADPGSARIGRY